MKNMIRNFSAGLVLLGCSISASASIIPTGIQTNTAFTDITDDGWSVLYRENTGLTSSIAGVFGGLAEDDWIILGGIRNSDDLVLVHAAVTWGDFSTFTEFNQTNTYNGADWYFNGFSMGFTDLGDSISQSTADISSFVNGNLGLSIHTNFTSGSNGQTFSNTQDSTVAPSTFGSGYRFGDVTFGNGETGYDFVVFTNDVEQVNAPGALLMLILGAGIVLSRKQK